MRSRRRNDDDDGIARADSSADRRQLNVGDCPPAFQPASLRRSLQPTSTGTIRRRASLSRWRFLQVKDSEMPHTLSRASTRAPGATKPGSASRNANSEAPPILPDRVAARSHREARPETSKALASLSAFQQPAVSRAQLHPAPALSAPAPCPASIPLLRPPPRSSSSCSPSLTPCRPQPRSWPWPPRASALGSVPVSTNVSPANCVDRCFFSAVMSTPAASQMLDQLAIGGASRRTPELLREIRGPTSSTRSSSSALAASPRPSIRTPAPAARRCVRRQSECQAPSARAPGRPSSSVQSRSVQRALPTSRANRSKLCQRSIRELVEIGDASAPCRSRAVAAPPLRPALQCSSRRGCPSAAASRAAWPGSRH